MIKLILFAIIGFAIYCVWAHLKKLKRQSQTPTDNTEAMVKCGYCEVYTPQSTALRGSNGQWYCCSDHERQARG